MKKLSYETLKEMNYNGYLLPEAPERVLQFGEGNFLRAFADYFIDCMNEKAAFNSKVVLCQPVGSGLSDRFNEQDGLYTLYLRGFENGQEVSMKRIISCVSRCINPRQDYQALLQCAANPDLRFILCNTTEAGIVYDPSCNFDDQPATSYPAKLTRFLFQRFRLFGREAKKGFIILSCELIDNNGKELKKCVLQYASQWNLGASFTEWVQTENTFCSTLVDRIVTGYPRKEASDLNLANGYEDNLLDTGEVFGFWVIEGPESLKDELPFEKAALPVLITNDHMPYKQRKVRILNGAHTAFVLGAYLSGQDIVRSCMDDSVICRFMNKTIYDEIIPTLTLPEKELTDFAAAVTERFKNPFIDHALLSISLNSTSKWKARVLPSLIGYLEKKQQLPACIVASFAFYLQFYRCIRREGSSLIGVRENGEEYCIQDAPDVLDFFYKHRNDSDPDYVHAVCTHTGFWGSDLSELPQFEETVLENLRIIKKDGCYGAMRL